VQTLGQRLRDRRLAQMVLVVRENPEYRVGPDQPFGLFVDSRHAWFLLALAGVAGARRRPLRALLLAAPWCHSILRLFGTVPRPRHRLPEWVAARIVIDAVDIAVMAQASVRHRTLFL